MEARLFAAAGKWPERLELRASADNPTSRILDRLNAPVIEGVGPLGTTAQRPRNRLAHSAFSGFLFDDPIALMEAPLNTGGPRLALNVACPNGFGAPTQCFAYYVDGVGGFYFAAHDPNQTVKTLHFFVRGDAGAAKKAGAKGPAAVKNSANPENAATIGIENHQWIERPGAAMRLGYPFVIAAMDHGDWFEAAELYRRWATAPPPDGPFWTRRGRVEDRAARGDWASWLSNGVAVCTFGLPASYDVSPWLRAIDAAAGGPVFHVLGHDWPAYAPVFVEGPEFRALQDAHDAALKRLGVEPDDKDAFRRLDRAFRALTPEQWNDNNAVGAMLQGLKLGSADAQIETARALRKARIALGEYRRKFDTGRKRDVADNYFPTLLKPENAAVLKTDNDPSAPFYNGFFASGQDLARDGLISRERNNALLARGLPDYAGRFMHPACDSFREFHAARGAAIATRGRFQAMYDDISASNTGLYTDRDAFGLAPGAGRALFDAYRRIFAETGDAASRAAGHHVPQGTEVMIENYLDVVDYGQWRVGGGVQGDMEGEEMLPWIKAGRARRIPLWSYLYHEYGGVRMDGWTKLARRFGELFFYTAAQVALEGQILEINYEFSPLERFPGIERPSPQLFYSNRVRLSDDAPEVDPAKLAWLGEATAARTDFAKDYLAWGRMVPPARIEGAAPDVEFDWSHYNDIDGRKEEGRQRVPSLVHAAWAYRRERAGLLFVNVLADRAQTVTVRFDVTRAGLGAPPTHARLATREVSSPIPFEQANGVASLRVTLPPRRIVLVELTNSSAQEHARQMLSGKKP